MTSSKSWQTICIALTCLIYADGADQAFGMNSDLSGFSGTDLMRYEWIGYDYDSYLSEFRHFCLDLCYDNTF